MKIYTMNNMIIVDHNGLSLYIDLGYLGSYHGLTILKHSEIYQACHENFKFASDYFEYLLGDLGTWEWKCLLCSRLGSKSYLKMKFMWFLYKPTKLEFTQKFYKPMKPNKFVIYIKDTWTSHLKTLNNIIQT